MLVTDLFERLKILYIPEFDFVIVSAGRYYRTIVTNVHTFGRHIVLSYYAQMPKILCQKRMTLKKTQNTCEGTSEWPLNCHPRMQ